MINDYYYYVKLMRNGFYDKLFFVDKLFLEWETLLDYGCADGFMTQMISRLFPNKRIIGYDENPQMIEIAKYSNEAADNVIFSSDRTLMPTGEIINLSSVIHELYTYSHKADIDNFWLNVFSEQRKMVIIRDMGFEQYEELTVAGPKLEMRVRDHAQAINAKVDLVQFEYKFGSIGYTKNMVHWLMKYPYHTSPNWNRELYENYLPVSVEALLSVLPEGWKVAYKRTYQLPYFTHLWSTDMGISVKTPTHLNLILTRS